MEFRRLGDSELVVSTVAVGTMNFGDRAGREESIRIVHKALDLGINFFDTANIYMDGLSEEILAQALGPRRKEVIVASKGGRVRLGEARKLARDSSPAYLISALEATLRRLKTDCVDLYQIHWPDPDTAFEVSVRALDQAVKDGKIRYIGVSNFDARQLAAARLGAHIISLQPPYSMFDRAVEAETLPYCVQNNIGIIPYSPLSKGILTGRFTPESVPQDATPEFRRRVALAEKLKPIAANLERPLGHVALAWLLSRPGVPTVIPGPSSVAQLVDNAGVSGWHLPESVRYEIDQILARG